LSSLSAVGNINNRAGETVEENIQEGVQAAQHQANKL